MPFEPASWANAPGLSVAGTVRGIWGGGCSKALLKTSVCDFEGTDSGKSTLVPVMLLSGVLA